MSAEGKNLETLQGGIREQLEKAREGADREALKKIQEVLEANGETMDSKQIAGALGLIQDLQRIDAKNPEASNKLITAIYEMVVNGKEIPKPGSKELAAIAMVSPEIGKFQGMADKVSTTITDLKNKMSVFGSDLFKQLEGLLGPNSTLGKVFGMLKNSTGSVAIYVQKTLKSDGKSLVNTNANKVALALEPMIKNAQTILKNTSYDITDHLKAMLVEANMDKPNLALQDFVEASKNVLNRYRKEAAPPAALASTPATQTPTTTPGTPAAQVQS